MKQTVLEKCKSPKLAQEKNRKSKQSLKLISDQNSYQKENFQAQVD